MNKQEILEQAKAMRENEVLEYQINIDNYRLAIEKAKLDPELVAFTNQLEELLKTSLLEQKKSQIMLEVVTEQLES